MLLSGAPPPARLAGGRSFAALLAAAALLAGCASRTTVEVTVVHAAGLPMDRFEIVVERDGALEAERSYDRASVDGETIVVWFARAARGDVIVRGASWLGAAAEPTARGSVSLALDGSARLAVTLALGDLADAGSDAAAPLLDGALPDAAPGTDAALPPTDGGAPGSDAAGPGTDAGPPVLDSTSCDDLNAGRLFCDGFEDPPLAAWPAVYSEMATIERWTAPPLYRGSGVLRAETSAGSGRAYVLADAFPALTGGDVWLRGYYYFPSGYPFSVVTFLFTGEASAPYDGIGLQGVSIDEPEVYVGPEGGVVFAGALATMPRDTWVCAELHVGISDTAGTIEFFFDGVLLGSGTLLDTLPASGLTRFVVGIEWTSSAQAPAVVYVDEAVADTAPIGCD